MTKISGDTAMVTFAWLFGQLVSVALSKWNLIDA